MRQLLCIDAPHFCAAVELEGEMVMRAAPIVRYMQSWSIERVRAYCEQKGWKHTEMKIEPKHCQKAEDFEQPAFHFVSGRLS